MEDITSAETRELPNKLHTGKSLSEALIFTSPQLTHNMTSDFSLYYEFSTRKIHAVYIDWFFVFVLTFRATYVYNISILYLYFSSTELEIQ